MNGTDVPALQAASDRFNTATVPLAEALMNAAARQLFGGQSTARLDADQL